MIWEFLSWFIVCFWLVGGLFLGIGKYLARLDKEESRRLKYVFAIMTAAGLSGMIGWLLVSPYIIGPGEYSATFIAEMIGIMAGGVGGVLFGLVVGEKLWRSRMG